MKCRGVLRSVEVHQPQVVRDDPLERVEVSAHTARCQRTLPVPYPAPRREWDCAQRFLQAGYRGHVTLLAEEAHANVVP